MRPPLYLYAFSATLNLQNTLELRRFLFEQGFMIRLDNLITGEVSVLHADDLKNDDIIMKLDPALYEFSCCYSSFVAPLPETIIAKVKRDPNVTEYNESKTNHAKTAF